MSQQSLQINLKRRIFLVCVCLAGFLTLAFPYSVCGFTDKEIGENGSPGANGAIPGQAGEDGGDGESVTADAGAAVPNPDADNTAIATGGTGGQGGNGANGDANTPHGGAGGNGGNGGDATANSATSGSNLPQASATSTASGGNGGNAGSGGQDFGTQLRGPEGDGGDGGAASSSAIANNNGGFETTATAMSYGGRGGRGSSGGDGGEASATAIAMGAGDTTAIAMAFAGSGGEADDTRGGNGGGANSFVHASSISTNGGVAKASVQLQAGDGGLAFFGGGNGGDGGDAILITDANSQIVSGSSLGGSVVLEQTAIAGSGGFTSDGLVDGRAGNATSLLTVNQSGENLSGTVQAFAGSAGGFSIGTSSGKAHDGGIATAGVNVTDTGNVEAHIKVVGGTGGRVFSRRWRWRKCCHHQSRRDLDGRWKCASAD